MELCSDNHEEVCYEGRNCPVCAEREELQGEIDNLKSEVDGLNDEIANIDRYSDRR